MIITEEITYQVDEIICHGFIAYKNNNHPKPCVLIVHDWSGCTQTFCDKAVKMAEEGYIGFAIDMYGNGATGNTTEEKQKLISPLLSDRKLLAKRILAAFNKAHDLPQVNSTKIAASGYCFGGLCVLDLARAGAQVKGVISFHGLLGAPDSPVCETVRAKILVLHGYDDPMVPPDVVIKFAKEMTSKKADWQIHMYGHTKHAFTNPQAHDLTQGLEFNANADNRAYASAKLFLNEIFC